MDVTVISYILKASNCNVIRYIFKKNIVIVIRYNFDVMCNTLLYTVQGDIINGSQLEPVYT